MFYDRRERRRVLSPGQRASYDYRDERISRKQDDFIRYVLPILVLLLVVVVAGALVQHFTGIDFGYRLGIR